MFSKEHIEAILITIAKPELSFYKSDWHDAGITLRMRVNFRAKEEFLLGLQRSLNQYQIDSIFRESEGSNRTGPLLYIGKRASLARVARLVPEELPCARSQWDNFMIALKVIESGEHLTAEGMLALKEAIHGTN